jgi:hypothetical protein
MKLDSKYFDSIRISPIAEETVEAPTCEWAGCTRHGGYRAPKGRQREGQYFNFCLEHVRDYNKSYNYFSGMADDEIDAYRRASATGHRPTWAMGSGGGSPDSHRGQSGSAGPMHDVFGLFEGLGQDFEPERRQRPLRNLERRSFAALNLDGGESRDEIKARFKALVKRLHPDANGGDRGSEDKLREIIQAYNHLKAAGFC